MLHGRGGPPPWCSEEEVPSKQPFPLTIGSVGASRGLCTPYLRLVCASSLAATLIPSTSGNRPPDHGTESEDDDNRLARIMRFLGHFASFPEAARNHTPSRRHAIKPLETTPRTIRRCLPRPDFLTACCLSGCWSLCCSTRASKPSSPSSRSSPRLSRRSVLRSQATRGLSTLTPVSYSQASFVACYDVKMIEC